MKVGIIGSGLIVSEFMEGAAEAADFEVVAICGRSESAEKVNALAKQYGIEKVYFDRAEFLRSGEIDSVYIALPNNLHFEASKQSLEAGKHVITEKPFTATYEEAAELFAIAERRGVFIFEAIATLYMPNFQKAREAVSSLGDIKIVNINYSQYSRRYERFKAGELPAVFNPAMAGGALMDLGVYNLHFVISLFGLPEEAEYKENIERGIDTSGVMILSYPHFKCALVAAKDCAAPCYISVQGDKGYLYSASSANMISEIEIARSGAEKEKFALNTKARMSYELEEFARIAKSNDIASYERAKEQTLNVMRVIKSAREGVIKA